MEQSIEDIRFLLAHQMKNRRKELGLTQAELASRMNVLQPHVARMEAIGPGSIESMLQWCIALDMKLVLEPLANAALVDKAMEDVEAIEELMDAEPEANFEITSVKDIGTPVELTEIVDFDGNHVATIEEVIEAGKHPDKAIVITDKTTVKKIREATPGEAVDFCKHGAVRGFCKKGCK